MGIKKYKPTSPGRRFQSCATFEELTSTERYRPLCKPLKNSGGRNSNGRITVRHRGGGHKRTYRVIDFKRNKLQVPAKVATIEYDPNRSCRIALLHYADGDKRYILAPAGLNAGDTVTAGPGSDIKPGNALPLSEIPDGIWVHNIEMKPGKGGQIARSAGNYCQIFAKEGGMVLLKLPSGELRRFRESCYATIGQVGNSDAENVKIGKAGRSRWLGKRPLTRGTARNPVDHPHGGGEGRTKGGRHPVTPWGVPTKGHRTRKKNNPSDQYIVRRRKK